MDILIAVSLVGGGADLGYTAAALKKRINKEINMNTLVSRAGAAIAAGILCISVVAAAEPTYEEVWTCTHKENKTIEDAQAANSTWLKWINDNVEGGNISSSVVSSVVGNTEIFLYVDSYPDLDTWSAAKAAVDTEEGQAVDEVFEAVSDCTENHLYKMTPTE